jgi:hypothetical protein
MEFESRSSNSKFNALFTLSRSKDIKGKGKERRAHKYRNILGGKIAMKTWGKSVKNVMESRVWWCTPVIPALGRLRREGHEFQASPGYRTRPCLKTKTKQTNKQKM